MTKDAPDIAIVAGEASGDLHGARLAARLKEMVPHAHIRGVGGPKMREAGVELLYDSSSWSAIGTAESLRLVPRLLLALSTLQAHLKARPPDAAVLIDFGAFNTRLGRRLHLAGVRVLYYFPPSSWDRNATYAGLDGIADRVVTPFPWSAEALRKRGIRADFFGHPLLDIAKPSLSREAFCARFGFDAGRPIIGLLPGSRRQELAHNLPVLMTTAGMLAEAMPELQFAIPVASSMDESAISRKAARGDGPPVKLLPGMAYDVLAHSRAAAIVSGTATVEAAILGCPMVIIYKGGGLTTLEFKLSRRRIHFVGMPNIILDRPAIPELTAGDASPRRVAELMLKLIDDSPERAQMMSDLEEARAALGSPGAIEKTAGVVIELLGSNA